MEQKEYKTVKIIGLYFTAEEIVVEIIDGDIKQIDFENMELYDDNNNKFENELLKEILTYEDGNIFRQIENSETDKIELYREDIKNVKTIEEFKEEVIDYSKTIFEGNIILKKTEEKIKKELEKEGYNEFHIQKLLKHKNRLKDFCLNVRILEDLINEKYIKLKTQEVEKPKTTNKKSQLKQKQNQI